ncbi:MAG: hypothetical protein R8M37_02765, partial [Alphaproteobacteria bacterium]|nr:hypothetical protein [Alphaproteobacteria bacterium]
AVELPGGNLLLPLYTEYVALANDLKVRKAALGMQPGIESEAILEGATSGLYDDVALGKTGGAYTSLARALSDPNGEDAKKWAAQKEATAKDKKTGTTLAAVGAIGSAVANIAINKNAPKESSDEIESKYDKKRVSAEEMEPAETSEEAGTDGIPDATTLTPDPAVKNGQEETTATQNNVDNADKNSSTKQEEAKKVEGTTVAENSVDNNNDEKKEATEQNKAVDKSTDGK